MHLDMARGLAALAVLLGHMRALFFVSYHELARHSLVLAAFYGMTTLGHQAVVIFFVLSGFFIVSSITGAFARGNWSWRAYLVNRVVRLSLVLIPALILCCLLDQAGMRWPAVAALYHRPVENLIATSVASLETVRNFAGSFFYVQSILVPPFGSDGPLWSLSYEFWYYILFPAALCALAARFRPRLRIVYFALAVLIVLFIGRVIAMYFLIWLLGGAMARASLPDRVPARVPGMTALGVTPLVCALGLSVASPLGVPFLTDSIVALGFAVWMYSVLGMEEKRLPAAYEKVARLTAGFSYTLYLTHFPVLFFIWAAVTRGRVWRPDGLHILLALAIAAAPLMIAYGLAQITEAKTALFRHKVMSLVG